jgi:hypothetical protein
LACHCKFMFLRRAGSRRGSPIGCRVSSPSVAGSTVATVALFHSASREKNDWEKFQTELPGNPFKRPPARSCKTAVLLLNNSIPAPVHCLHCPWIASGDASIQSARAAIAATPPPRTLRRADAMAQSWDALRKDARRLETEIDAKLVTYSRLSAALSTFSSRASGFDGACRRYAHVRCRYFRGSLDRARARPRPRDAC